MITGSKLQRVIQRLQGSDATFFEYEGPQGILRLRFGRQSGAQLPRNRGAESIEQPTPGKGKTLTPLRSPGIGFLCVEHPLLGFEAAPKGASVKEGEILAFLRAGDFLMPVVADRDAAAALPIAQDGALIAYGDVLFELG